MDSVGLVAVLNNLNRGLDFGGNPLGTQSAFFIGVAVNPFASNLEEEIQRLVQKVRAGANFAVTTPVFDVQGLRDFLRRVAPCPIPVAGSIWPLTSFRHAEYLHNEVPGVRIPAAIMARMRQADTGEPARAEGLRIARELLRELRPLVNGVQITPPLGRYAMAAETVETLREAKEK